jgi:catechol-2,3-dioxygenase
VGFYAKILGLSTKKADETMKSLTKEERISLLNDSRERKLVADNELIKGN